MNTGIKEQIVLYFRANPHKIVSKVKLEHEMKIRSFEKRVFDASVNELIKENILISTKRGKLVTNRNIKYVIGKIYTNSKGYGFVVSPNETVSDLFIPVECVNNALHEDRVVARIIKNPELNKRAEGEVISILSRKLETVIGTFMSNGTFGFVVPDNQKINKDIYIPQGCCNNAKDYDKVVCQITKYPEKNKNPEGEITEVIGLKWDKGVDVLSIIRENNISPEFPSKVLKQAESLPDSINEIEYKRRIDLRKMTIFTIDGEDAKDLDDAVSIEMLDDGRYKLGVHIADVAHYVYYGSKIDKEAFDRGISVYLIDTVIPMLPKKLSNHLCSLHPNTDKLALSVFMTINRSGVVEEHTISESIINSAAKLNYTEVSDFLEKNDEAFAQKHPNLVDSIKMMKELALILKKKRESRGAINFDFPECKITLNEDGKVRDVTQYERRISNQIIEEFMLVCNETIAEDFYWRKIPFVYRVHENPREEKLKSFCEFVKNYGYSIAEDIGSITAKTLQDFLSQIKGKKEEMALNLLLLQSMQQARYNPVCKGHFGLATKFYCHFTSPIRRYPDLQIHRIIKECINGGLSESKLQEYEKIVEACAKTSSRRERIAEQAEEELYTLRKLEYMDDKKGQVFEGIVTSMNSKGVFVTLDNTVEGFLKSEELPGDCYELYKEQHAFVGKVTGNKVMIGDAILVSVDKVNLDTRELLFKFISQ